MFFDRNKISIKSDIIIQYRTLILKIRKHSYKTGFYCIKSNKMKKDLNVLIKRIKGKTGLTQDEIGKRIKYGHSQFALLKKANDQDVYQMLEHEFHKELNDKQIDIESIDTIENLLTLSASVKMLYEEVSILKAKNEGTTTEKSIEAMRMRTKTIISGLT